MEKKIEVLTIAYNFYPQNNAEALVATTLLNVDSNINFNIYTLNKKEDNNIQKIRLVRNLKVIQIDNRIIRFLPDWKIFNNKYTWAVKSYIKAKKEDFDVIYSRSTPMVDHFIGFFLKLRTGKPLVIHLSDPWLDSPYRIKIPILNFIIKYLENLIFKNADLIIVTNENYSSFLRKKYINLINKIKVLPHPMKQLSIGKLNKKNNKTVLSHLGEFYKKRLPDPILELLEGSNNINIQLNFVGNNKEDKVFKKISKYGVADKIRFYGKVSYEESLKIGLNSDYLLLVDANLPDNKFFLPSKLIDYLAIGKPIITITNKGSPVHKILSEQEDFLLFYEDSEEKNAKKLKAIFENEKFWEERYLKELTKLFLLSRLYQQIISVICDLHSSYKNSPPLKESFKVET